MKLKFDKENYLNVGMQPLAGSSFINWAKLLIENRFRIDWQFIPKALYVTIMTVFLTPFRLIEKKIDKEIKEIKIAPPLFIVGHFRSGTTFLHYMMGQDKNLAYVSTLETMAPWVFLKWDKFFKKIVKRHLPEKRPMDDLEMEADLPYEEEYAIANLSQYSFYHGWYFPKRIFDYFRKYVLFEGVSKEIKEKWKKIYIYLLQKITYKHNGKRILLKSPVNTGRIKLLLETFPDAKFIHICRNPYKVYLSTWRLYEKILPIFSFQHVKREEIDRLIFDFYKGVYKKYFAERDLIPEGNLVEIRYEEFVKKPIEILESVYKDLNLEGFKKAKPNFEKFFAKYKDYKPYTYRINEEIKEKVYREWGFAFEKLGYQK